jgi:hypothetical protein
LLTVCQPPARLPAPKVHIANLRRQSVSTGKFANHFGFADLQRATCPKSIFKRVS